LKAEDPAQLIKRLRLGREEFCQRLLTMLILAGPYPRWNTPSVVSPKGLIFLRLLDDLSFGSGSWSDSVEFVDEFDMPRRHDEERGCAPDYAVRAEDRLWLIELKTEKASHRRDQIPSYFEFGRHYHPTCAIDITYLTPPTEIAVRAPEQWGRFAHVSWDSAAEMVRKVWEDSSDRTEGKLTASLLDTLDRLLVETPTEWRARLLEAAESEGIAPAGVPLETAVAEAVRLAGLTAKNREQRAVAFRASDLEELQEWRLEVRQAIKESDDEGLQHVMPWLWKTSSTGPPLTEGGVELGYELRLSWYKAAIYKS